MKIYVILDTDSLSRPWRFVTIAVSKKVAQTLKSYGYTVEEYSLVDLIRRDYRKSFFTKRKQGG